MCGQCNLRELNNDVFATVGVFFHGCLFPGYFVLTFRRR
jgi:hypothetical protein